MERVVELSGCLTNKRKYYFCLSRWLLLLQTFIKASGRLSYKIYQIHVKWVADPLEMEYLVSLEKVASPILKG